MDKLDDEYQNAGLLCQPRRPVLVDRLLALIMPWNCVLCRQPSAGMDLCIACLNDLPWIGPACRYCAATLVGEGVCGQCQRGAPLQGCLAALRYEYPAAQMAAALKYRRKQPYGRVLAELLAIRVREAYVEGRLRRPDVLVPIPLHPRRYFSRRFNQAELIAVWLSRELGIRVVPTALKRTKNTAPQTGKRRRARQQNLPNSFAGSRSIQGQHIAMVDDVMTTGATLYSAARTLRACGAVAVQGWVVARA
jgi:ComF family protein